MTGRSVGVQAVAVYAGSAYVEAADLFAARGLDPARFDNIGMRRKGVPLPCEDVVSFAVNAAQPIVDALTEEQRGRIETLVVATESAIDLAKAASTYVHDLLGLSRSCRLFEVKQACHAGVAALQSAAALVALAPRDDALALVIAADLPMPNRGAYAEVASGAGAVAMLVGEPRLARLWPGEGGFSSYETTDFCRPRPGMDVLDVDHSLLSYVDGLLGSFNDYAERFPGTDFQDSFAGLAMHTPFPGMVKGAHRTAMRKLKSAPPPAVAADFAARVAASVRLPALVGNIYSGSTMLALTSALALGELAPGATIGVFSYGGGCSAEFGRAVLGPQRPDPALLGGLLADDSDRVRVDVPRYDALVDRSAEAGFGVRDAHPDLAEFRDLVPPGQRRLLLAAVDDYHRSYSWERGAS